MTLPYPCGLIPVPKFHKYLTWPRVAPEPQNKHFSHSRTSPGGHLAPGSACASMRAHARVCVRLCFVLQVLGQVLQELSRSVVLQVLFRNVVLQVLGRMWVVLQVLGLVLQVLGLGLGLGLLQSSLFTHPQNFIFANPGQPRSLKIIIYFKWYRNHPGAQKNVIYPGWYGIILLSEICTRWIRESYGIVLLSEICTNKKHWACRSRPNSCCGIEIMKLSF